MKRLLATIAFASALHVTCNGVASAQTPYVGEVRLFAFNFCPTGWLQAKGQILPINQYANLFALLGTTYGGDGTITFALPNLNGRAPYGIGDAGNGVPIGSVYGSSTITLPLAQMPQGATNPTITTESTFAVSFPRDGAQVAANGNVTSNRISVQSPALAMNWCIAAQGYYVPRN